MIPAQHITLSELQRRVKECLEGAFPLPLWVAAEIAECKVNRSGHCYLELIEKGDDDTVPRAQARAVIWRSHYAQLAPYFAAQTGGRELAAGLRILARVVVNYHALYGFSLQITDLDPAFTLGDMARQRQLTIARLQQEGVWEMNRELELPAVVQRIAVVSSPRAAGYQDFCNELGKSPYRFALTLFEATVQGPTAEESLVAALEAVAARAEAFDAVAMIRGGGSASDLGCFDAYRLCCHVAQFPLPVLTGIGHDKDTSVADLVAHTALKTPTAVAAWLVERMAEVEGWLDRAAQGLRQLVGERSHACTLQLTRATAELDHAVRTALAARTARLDRCGEALHDAARQPLRRESARLDDFARRLREGAADRLVHENRRLAAAGDLLVSHSLERVLQRGFAVVRRDGRAIASAAELHAGDRIEIRLRDGVRRAEIRE